MLPHSYYGYHSPSVHSYWTRRKWFTLTVFLLLFWVVIYLFTHAPAQFTGYKYSRFSAKQVQHISNILANNEAVIPKAIKSSSESSQPGAARTALADSDRIYLHSSAAHVKVKCDTCTVSKAMDYINGEFGDRIDEQQLYSIREYMLSFGPYESGTYLATTDIKVKSFFWLTGPLLYIEAIFWALMGVLCNVLFTIGADIRAYPGRRNSKYYTSKIPYDIAKFLYAPFCTIVLLLCYNYIKHRNIVEVNASEGVIVFAFIAGLFSSKMMGALEKIKDAIIPEYRYSYKPYQQTQRSRPIPLRTERRETAIRQPFGYGHSIKEKRIEVLSAGTAQTLIDTDTPDTQIIKEIQVELKLDSGGLFEDERTEILNAGFNDAAVTLHNVNGKDIIPFIKSPEAAFFIIEDVKPGIYIIRATLTQQLNDRYIMNLFGEKTIFITHENSKIELPIKKYEAFD